MEWKCKRLTSNDLGTVHSDTTAAVLLHKHFSSWLSTLINIISIITNCMNGPNITAYVNNSFTFLKSAYYI